MSIDFQCDRCGKRFDGDENYCANCIIELEEYVSSLEDKIKDLELKIDYLKDENYELRKGGKDND